jgi:hypothetical protein
LTVRTMAAAQETAHYHTDSRFINDSRRLLAPEDSKT